MKPLSPHMRASLFAIHHGGSTCTPEGGGWWKGLDGRRLFYKLQTDQRVIDVKTINVYALAERGLVEQTNPGVPRWRAQYRITAAGNALLDQWSKEPVA